MLVLTQHLSTLAPKLSFVSLVLGQRQTKINDEFEIELQRKYQKNYSPQSCWPEGVYFV